MNKRVRNMVSTVLCISFFAGWVCLISLFCGAFANPQNFVVAGVLNIAPKYLTLISAFMVLIPMLLGILFEGDACQDEASYYDRDDL